MYIQLYTCIVCYTITILGVCTPQTLELEAYIKYAENYMMAKTRLEELVDHPDVVEYFKSQPTNHLREAMKYIVPKSLDEPCYHCFHYFDAIEVRGKERALSQQVVCEVLPFYVGPLTEPPLCVWNT